MTTRKGLRQPAAGPPITGDPGRPVYRSGPGGTCRVRAPWVCDHPSSIRGSERSRAAAAIAVSVQGAMYPAILSGLRADSGPSIAGDSGWHDRWSVVNRRGGVSVLAVTDSLPTSLRRAMNPRVIMSPAPVRSEVDRIHVNASTRAVRRLGHPRPPTEPLHATSQRREHVP
jgi:hypothetical protein